MNFLSEIQNSKCLIGRNFCLINRSGEGNYLGVFTCFDWYSILVRLIKKSFQSMHDSSRSIETCENRISVEFSDNCSKRLKRFQVLWMVLWKILTLHTYLLKGYNTMGINWGLCSLETQEILWIFFKIAICRTQ